LLSLVVLGVVPNLVGVIVGTAIAGIGLGGVKVCREMILADRVDRSRERCGHRCEGVYDGLNRFIGRLPKILEALALALIGVWSLVGYLPGGLSWKVIGRSPGTLQRIGKGTD
jgi:Na+/melibiose symporter-like transporter